MCFIASRLHFVAIIAFLCVLLTACMVGPDFHSPKSPKVKSYTNKPLSTKTVSTPGAGSAGKSQVFELGKELPADWWYLFRSQEINHLVALGLANNPTLAASQAALRQAKEAVNVQVGNSLYPALSAQFTASRQKFSDETFGVNGPNPTFNLFNPSLNIAYTMDVFGGARRQIEALAAQVDYQAYLLEASYLTMTSNIVTTAITASSLSAQIQATHALIQAQEETLAVIQQQYRLGGASGADLLTQETTVAQTRATLPPLEQRLAQSLHVLATLIGAFPSEVNLPVIPLEQLHLPTHLPVSLPSSLARQRPDIRASEALLHAASAQIGVATANLYPQFTINGSYGWVTQLPADIFKHSSYAWSLSGQVLQPIFNGGALRAAKRQAIAAYEQADAQYRQTVLQAFRNVADSLRAIENDSRAFRAQRAAEKAARSALSLTQEQYRLGGVSFLSLLAAQRQYQETKIARIQAQASRYNDTVALFQALGGGWWSKEMDKPGKVKKSTRRAC